MFAMDSGNGLARATTPTKENTMNRIANLSTLMVTLAVASVAGYASAAEANGTWAKHHPRRAEVNARLARQDHRINQERKEGDLTRQEAHTLHQEDKSIRTQERDMAKLNGGHITKSQQKLLNQEENQVSKEIGK